MGGKMEGGKRERWREERVESGGREREEDGVREKEEEKRNRRKLEGEE